MSEPLTYFQTPPRQLSEDAFVDRFGEVYEHSPWIARDTYRAGLNEQADSAEGLAAAMSAATRAAGDEALLALIRAHPDLAGKAAKQGQLTADSASEQAGAGIDQCTPEEYERFQRYNAAYQQRFGFPFVMAVKGSNRHLILAAFEERLQNDAATEFQRALNEIDRIALFRLQTLAAQTE
jgi:2-oxo-4-hydroxy-4-carboxy-5-ureidoimidazoline decarboxylase